MKNLNQIYINGKFEKPHGTEVLDIHNPADEELLGTVVLGDEQDAACAILSASNAFEAFSKTTVNERKQYLRQLNEAFKERLTDLQDATVLEYGAPRERARWSNQYAADCFVYFQNILDDFAFERTIGDSHIILEPIGVTAILTAWNSSAGSICIKLAAAIAAGCTVVIKPSEMSALQTQIMMECFDKASLPAGVINVVNGRGNVLGEILSSHPAIAKVTFTGSTEVGKIIASNSASTMKRLTLELSGKSPNIILDDAQMEVAIPMAVQACFQNNGQACIAGSRLIVPEKRIDDVKRLVVASIKTLKVGDPKNSETVIGPLANQKQYDRVQRYIRLGIESGAELLIGGEGKPSGLSMGYFVKPTAFAGVTPNMTIAREEIFGPVISILTYKTEEEAVRIANDTPYGLLAYISSIDIARANRVARQINAGRVLINTLKHDPYAPFGGFKQSGIGREGGIYGLEGQLEPKAVLIA